MTAEEWIRRALKGVIAVHQLRCGIGECPALLANDDLL